MSIAAGTEHLWNIPDRIAAGRKRITDAMIVAAVSNDADRYLELQTGLSKYDTLASQWGAPDLEASQEQTAWSGDMFNLAVELAP